jgi:hypothetical protein
MAPMLLAVESSSVMYRLLSSLFQICYPCKMHSDVLLGTNFLTLHPSNISMAPMLLAAESRCVTLRLLRQSMEHVLRRAAVRILFCTCDTSPPPPSIVRPAHAAPVTLNADSFTWVTEMALMLDRDDSRPAAMNE